MRWWNFLQNENWPAPRAAASAQARKGGLVFNNNHVKYGLGMIFAAFAAVVVLAAAPVEAQEQLPDYTFQPGDELQIDVWREEDMQRLVVVRPDGKFSFPLSGEIVAVNRTPAQVQAELTERLTPYIPEVVVTVSVTKLEGNQVYVIGQVQSPGRFIMNPRLNVLQALSVAGGTTPFASPNNIIIVRGRGANQEILRFRYDDISRGRNLEQNVLLEAGDVVIVP
jgi:polysaccharide biosynthesis/export protein